MSLIKCDLCEQHFTHYGMDRVDDPQVGNICTRCGNDAKFFARWWRKFSKWAEEKKNGR